VTHVVHAGANAHSRIAVLGTLERAVDRLRTRRELASARRAADREILLSPAPSLRHSWRAAELATPKNRLELAGTLREIVRESDARYLPSASAVNRVAVRAHADGLLALGDRLSDLERPVAARGILLVDHLLTDTSGPLYDRDRVEALPFYIDAARETLEAA
jgi:hypothetical protein